MSISEDNAALNERMQSAPQSRRRAHLRESSVEPDDYVEGENEKDRFGKLSQWTTGDGKRFLPAGHTKKALPPGVYEIHHSSTIGLYFEKIPVRTEGLIRFPQTNSEKVLKEIDVFWSRENVFKEYGLTYKRGIILWGPPGGGKTCTVNLIMKDVVIDRKGIVIKFTNPGLFIEGMRILREIQPDTPVVVLMEDIDSIIEHYEESPVLNILDGVESVQKVVFLATTNYPEYLGPRIINRPSRFDKRFHIGYPNPDSRMLYFKHLASDKELDIDFSKWVKDTADFSIAHLKELFVAVVILGDEYDEALENLKLMKEDISSDKDNGKNFNLFGRGRGSADNEY